MSALAVALADGGGAYVWVTPRHRGERTQTMLLVALRIVAHRMPGHEGPVAMTTVARCAADAAREFNHAVDALERLRP